MRKLMIQWLLVPFIVGAAPLREIPLDQYNDFTLNRKIPVRPFYRDDSYPPESPLVYDFATVEKYKESAYAKRQNYYGDTDSYLYDALDLHRFEIEGKKIGVLGSVVPWYEAIVLAYEGHPVTIEYNRILSQHPDLRTMTVEEYDAHPELFDALLSISSFEHDGLGRYGDPINPEGDFAAMDRAKQMLKPGGLLFLAVPVGRDLVAWNAHRVYGPLRLPLLLKGWTLVESFGFQESDFQRRVEDHQPVFVLRKE